MSKKTVISIFIYYAFLFFNSLFLLIRYFSIGNLLENDVYIYASLSGLLSSTVFYIRKLYKDCLQEDKICDNPDSLKQIASFVYYLTRPLIAAAFSIIIIIGLKAGFIIISNTKSEINQENFLYTSVFLSFICGFRVGKLINKFENFEIIK